MAQITVTSQRGHEWHLRTYSETVGITPPHPDDDAERDMTADDADTLGDALKILAARAREAASRQR